MTKKKWLGAFLSFLIPGLGNAYSRNVKKGILIYILFFIVVLGLRFIAYNFTLFLVALSLMVGYYLFAIIVGYRNVQKDKIYEPLRFDKWYVYVLAYIFNMVFLSLLTGKTLDKITPINFASIPTPAMDPALLPGDILAYKKTKSIERNDVTIFLFPDDTKTMYVKRCIGLPGDSLQIVNSAILINGVKLTNIPLLRYRYIVLTDGSEIDAILKKNNITGDEFYRVKNDTYYFFLTDPQAQEFKKKSSIKVVESLVTNKEEADSIVYPKSERYKWNTDFYGPLYIPQKGSTIQLTDKNIDLYLKCIEFENASVISDSTGVKINGQAIVTYQFKSNYFFMMGDNRHNSLDSRYWGFLPQELVVGKAMYLYWSRTHDRIGKTVM